MLPQRRRVSRRGARDPGHQQHQCETEHEFIHVHQEHFCLTISINTLFIAINPTKTYRNAEMAKYDALYFALLGTWSCFLATPGPAYFGSHYHPIARDGKHTNEEEDQQGHDTQALAVSSQVEEGNVSLRLVQVGEW